MDAIDRTAAIRCAENCKTGGTYCGGGDYGEGANHAKQEILAALKALPSITAGVKVDAKALKLAKEYATCHEDCTCNPCVLSRELIRIAEAGQDAGPGEATPGELPPCPECKSPCRRNNAGVIHCISPCGYAVVTYAEHIAATKPVKAKQPQCPECDDCRCAFASTGVCIKSVAPVADGGESEPDDDTELRLLDEIVLRLNAMPKEAMPRVVSYLMSRYR